MPGLFFGLPFHPPLKHLPCTCTHHQHQWREIITVITVSRSSKISLHTIHLFLRLISYLETREIHINLSILPTHCDRCMQWWQVSRMDVSFIHPQVGSGHKFFLIFPCVGFIIQRKNPKMLLIIVKMDSVRLSCRYLNPALKNLQWFLIHGRLCNIHYCWYYTIQPGQNQHYPDTTRMFYTLLARCTIYVTSVRSNCYIEAYKQISELIRWTIRLWQCIQLEWCVRDLNMWHDDHRHSGYITSSHSTEVTQSTTWTETCHIA